jgi:brefeldin A-resistance guanine nucleotide exchange factor 1
MTVIQDCMCGSVGALLGDVEVCEMLETVLTTCCQMRLSGECSTWSSLINSY